MRAINAGGGLTAEDAWNELPHYFDGLALKLVGRRSANESAEAAVEKAWKRLDRHFSQRKLTPKECLQDILDAGEIDKFDEQGHIELAINLEAEIDEAEALGTASAFDEPPLLNEVLYRKIRYFTEEFWGRVAREDAVPTFRRLIRDIEWRAEVLRRKGQYVRLGQGSGGGKSGGSGGSAGKQGGNGEEKKDNAGSNNNNHGGGNGKGNGGGNGGGGNGNQGGRNHRQQQQQQHQHGPKCGSSCDGQATTMSTTVSTNPPSTEISMAERVATSPTKQQQSLGPCTFCGGSHHVDDCRTMWDEKRYPDGAARRTAFRDKDLCFNCAETGHATADCQRPRAKCIICGKNHRTALHEDNHVYKAPTFGDFLPRGNRKGSNISNVIPVTTAQNRAPAPPTSNRIAPLVEVNQNVARPAPEAAEKTPSAPPTANAAVEQTSA